MLKGMLKNSWVYLSALILIACRQEVTEGKLLHEERSYQENRCIEDVCASIQLNYPFYNGDEAALGINSEIENMLIRSIAFEEPAENLAVAVSNYLDDFERLAKDYGAFSEWFINIEIKETFQNEELLTVLVKSSSFLGGAHPNSNEVLVNFNSKSGETLPLKAIKFDFGKLLVLVEEKFRLYHGVPEGLSLEEDGRFFLKNDKDFFLPQNLGFDEKGLLVIYNPYEIGPYVLGMTSIHIPWEELNGAASPELKLK